MGVRSSAACPTPHRRGMNRSAGAVRCVVRLGRWPCYLIFWTAGKQGIHLRLATSVWDGRFVRSPGRWWLLLMPVVCGHCCCGGDSAIRVVLVLAFLLRSVRSGQPIDYCSNTAWQLP